MKKYKGINRVENKAHYQQGWLARHFVDGKKITKQFADKKYGGRTEALQAALLWRAEQEKLQPSRNVEAYAPFQRAKVRSNTGVLGVSKTHALARHDRRIKYEVFSVSYYEDGRKGCKRFYIDSYDNENEALADAIGFRREKEQGMLRYWQQQQREKANAAPDSNED